MGGQVISLVPHLTITSQLVNRLCPVTGITGGANLPTKVVALISKLIIREPGLLPE